VKRHPASDGPLACGDSIETAMVRWIQAKTVLTEMGPVEIDVLYEWDGTSPGSHDQGVMGICHPPQMALLWDGCRG
jgi:hypothetical protein